MAKFLGMGGFVTVSSVDYPVTTWAYTESSELQDVTDTGSSGWIARIAGVSGGELTFTAFYDSATVLMNVFAAGTSMTVTLTAGSAGSPPTVTGTFLVSSFTLTNGAKTPVEFQCTAQSSGAITTS